MKMIVGLGNPGKKYEKTRHNIGFELVDRLAAAWVASPPRVRNKGEVAEVTREQEKILIVKPQTFMNLSGESIQPLRDFHKIEHRDILVVCDDLSLNVGQIRLRANGSSGGQKGLADILLRLGTHDLPRLRIGIGATPQGWETTDYVLGRFGSEDREVIDATLVKAQEAVEFWIREGIEKAMSRFNAAPAKPLPPKTAAPKQQASTKQIDIE
jgi:PTH1 family peptidyl-tRNA hydrolase